MTHYHLMTRSWKESSPALISGDQALTWHDLHERVARSRGWLLDRGLEAGDVLALQTGKHLAFLDLHLAALSLGIVTLPINDQYTRNEVTYLLGDAGTALACVLEGTAHQLVDAPCPVMPLSALDHLSAAPAEPSEPAADDLAVLCYTSGTTGHPKGARLSHANLTAMVSALHDAWAWSPDDVLVHALPLYHVHGLFVAQHVALWSGATTIWLDRFDPLQVLQAIERHRGTVYMGVPTHYRRLLDLPDGPRDLSSMRLFTSGSAPLPPSDHRAFQDRFGHAILERYGMTEVGIVLSNPYGGERRPGAVGFPLPGVTARIVNDSGHAVGVGVVGHLEIGGPTVFSGYHGRPEQTRAVLRDGWMHTGDLAHLDGDAYIHIDGRADDMILSGGFNVYPREVEAALLEHPLVAQAAVVGIVDPDLGNRVVASLVADGSLRAEHVTAWLADRLAPYKQPRAYAFVETLPRNAMSKVQRHLLRQQWSEIQVREARADEAEHIASWNVTMARETEGMALDPAVALAGTRAIFERPVGGLYLRAEVAGAVVGQCMVTREWSDWRNRDVWWIQSVYVPPAWRRRGVYRALHEAVLSRARSAGAGGVRLYVDRSNERAQAVYAKVGMDGDHYRLFERMWDDAAPESP